MLTKVKELRAQHGLTQQQLADLVHVSSRTIISIEKGQYSPSLMLTSAWPKCSASRWRSCAAWREFEKEDETRENLS